MEYLTWKSYNFNQSPFKIFETIKNRANCFFLDSSANQGSLGRYSFLGLEPFYIFKTKNIKPFSGLRTVLKQHRVRREKSLPPFLCGAVGFFAYDLGLLLENKLVSRYRSDSVVPNCLFAFYDSLIAIDNFQKKLFAIALNKQALKKIIKLLGEIEFNKPIAIAKGKSDTSLNSNFTQTDYIKAVDKAKGYIRNGDIYQVNLAQRFTARSRLTAFEIYQRLRKVSPSCFSAYLDCANFQIISSSPERFLKLNEGLVQSRPMKGTRPRAKEKLRDSFLKQELLNSEKDKAELMMIVDLMRNDLGRVCEYSSIRVSSLRNLEKYKTVFQTTATIEGKLYQDMDSIDLIKACFPGGSITGCPKIRAMEIISEIEPHPRDIYTGSLGYLSFCGNLDLNILIRTILKQKDKLTFSVGSGIVADSVPEDEYVETLTKAKGILQAIT